MRKSKKKVVPAYDEDAARLRSIGAVAMMGEIFADTQKEKNDWKARMIKAGLGEAISMPEDWDTLSEQEKEKRLNKVIGVLTEK